MTFPNLLLIVSVAALLLALLIDYRQGRKRGIF
jgi:hypothetical protein